MELVDEIEFLIDANKKHENSPKKNGDFIKEVGRLFKKNTISKEAFEIAIELFPPRDLLVKKAMMLLSKMGEREDSGSSRNSSC